MNAQEAERYFREHRDRHLSEYFEFLRIPSISALPAHASDVRRAAAWVAERCRRAGLEHTQTWETGGHPVVYADWLHAPGRPTMLVYGHFDVQPVDPVDQWDTPPFEPTIRDGRVYARGAADDKVMILPLIVAEAMLRVDGRLPLNLKCFFEGQEEILSPQLAGFIPRVADTLGCDFVVSADGAQWSADQPSITLGRRGIASLQIDVEGPNKDLAAGGHGGGVQNPIHALAGILASMRGPDGVIRVPGFYDRVLDPDPKMRDALRRVPFDEAAYFRGVGVDAGWGERGWSNLERRWLRPTLEINGIWGGYQGEGSKSVLPARAGAKISCRLVPDQIPEEIADLLAAHVAAQAPPGVRVHCRPLSGFARPSSIPADHPIVDAAARVLAEVFARPVVYMYSGGTLPVADLFLTHLRAQTLTLAFSSPDEQVHAPNEFYRLRNFDRGLRAYCALLSSLASVWPGS